MNKRFKKGDAVVYCPGYTEDIGRVADAADDNNTYVCFTSGCTAAACPDKFLRPATVEEAAKAAAIGIGYHRFDDYCPKFDSAACMIYCPDKEKPMDAMNKAFKRNLASGITAVGRMLGYDGVYNENDCSCRFDVFPACGDICNGRFGYVCHRYDCTQEDACVSADSVCPDDCEFFERRQDLELD